MSNHPENQNCPECTEPIPADAPEGICPQCVLLQGVIPEAGPHESSAEIDLEKVATLFPGLEVAERIGGGGMGTVFKVRQPRLDRTAALKLLTGTSSSHPEFRERFLREARALARLDHPGIV
ncbi:MAG: serine/threonine protein kinase, partial [Verrucomicrobiota bacterium]